MTLRARFRSHAKVYPNAYADEACPCEGGGRAMTVLGRHGSLVRAVGIKQLVTTTRSLVAFWNEPERSVHSIHSSESWPRVMVSNDRQTVRHQPLQQS
jgi:hypothetical protein